MSRITSHYRGYRISEAENGLFRIYGRRGFGEDGYVDSVESRTEARDYIDELLGDVTTHNSKAVAR